MTHPASLGARPEPAPPSHATVTWADPGRQHAFEQWLQAQTAAHGLHPASLRPASADASFRRYLRIDGAAGSSLIIMDAPPDKEDCRPFVKVAGLMQQAGLRVPQVLAWDEGQGFMLLSDLGAQTMMQVITAGPAQALPLPLRGQPTHDLFLAAIDTLVRWQCASQPDVLAPYDDALLTRELGLFPEWYVGRHRQFTLDAGQQQTLQSSFELIRQHNLQALGGARVYVHRDFMPRNLMAGVAGDALGVLDFQDAVYGPITYDIASLMRDAFISWDEEFVIDITVRYWQQARQAGLPVGADFGEFYEAVEWMGLQRHLKILGIFARLTLRDGKPQYLADTPRFIAYVRQSASRYRLLAPLLRLLEQIEGGAVQAGYTF
ncbi:MAG: phosphotransferase [Betaproteobacteria bacterium]